jgi:Ca2+-binding EF-hand superfamily protein
MEMVQVKFIFKSLFFLFIQKKKNFSVLVEFDEFVKVMGSVYERKFTDDEMRRAFKCFDTDNSGKKIFIENYFSLLFILIGYITINELREVLSRLNHNVSEHRLSEVLREIDTDRDGKISYKEFVHMLQEV